MLQLQSSYTTLHICTCNSPHLFINPRPYCKDFLRSIMKLVPSFLFQFDRGRTSIFLLNERERFLDAIYLVSATSGLCTRVHLFFLFLFFCVRAIFIKMEKTYILQRWICTGVNNLTEKKNQIKCKCTNTFIAHVKYYICFEQGKTKK